jgi:mono/diheme cytochrome c family protein
MIAMSGPVVFLLFLLLPGTAGSASSTTPVPDWDVFAAKGCAQCHRIRGFGDGSSASDLGTMRSGTGFVEIVAAMWNHLAEMRAAMRAQQMPWPRFTPQEFSNLVEFLFAAQQVDIARDPVEGERVFAAKGCERCHATSGSGEQGAPPVPELRRSTSSVLMAAAMWNHVVRPADSRNAAGVSGRAMATAELQDIVAYIRAAGQDVRGESVPLVVGVPDRGKRLFAARGCAGCHGAKGSSGPVLVPRGPRASVTALPAILWNHRLVVRRVALSRVSGQDMADITSHLHASYYFDPFQGDVRRGRRHLTDKGCLKCHALHGTGATAAPDFSRSNVVSSKLGQLTSMWNHGRYMETEARRRGITWPKLTAEELSDITAYLAVLGRAPRR